MQPVVDRRKIKSGEEFQLKGLSSFPYVVTVTATGGVEQNIPVNTASNRVQDLGTVALKASPRIQFTYVSQPIADTSLAGLESQNQIVECNGKNRFLMTERRDELGNELDLRLKVIGNGNVIAGFWFSPSYFWDLGTKRLADGAAKIPPALIRGSLEPQEEQVLEDGHTYYFECPGKDIACMFEVHLVDAAEPADAK